MTAPLILGVLGSSPRRPTSGGRRIRPAQVRQNQGRVRAGESPSLGELGHMSQARRFLTIGLVPASLALPTAPAPAQPRDLASWVDPMIGPWPPGFVSPGPVLPHGMVGLGPDTEGPINYGGYYRHNA